MIDGSEKHNGWLNFERQSPHVIERRGKVNCQFDHVWNIFFLPADV